MALQIDARLDDRDAFAFEEFSLEGSVRFADQDFSALTDDAVPGNAFSGRSRGHGAPRAARAAGKAESFSEGPIG